MIRFNAGFVFKNRSGILNGRTVTLPTEGEPNVVIGDGLGRAVALTQGGEHIQVVSN